MRKKSSAGHLRLIFGQIDIDGNVHRMPAAERHDVPPERGPDIGQIGPYEHPYYDGICEECGQPLSGHLHYWRLADALGLNEWTLILLEEAHALTACVYALGEDVVLYSRSEWGRFTGDLNASYPGRPFHDALDATIVHAARTLADA